MPRIIALIDMDCFYVQVEQRLNPELYDKPVVVCQLSNNLSPGIVLAVSYEARTFGIKRGMSATEMKHLCPEINLCMMPVLENMHKTDLSRYRSASDEVFRVLESVKNVVVEKASVDEAYLDLTEAVEMEMAKWCSDDLVEYLVADLAEAFPSTHLADGNDVASSENQGQVTYNREGTLRQWLESCCRGDILQLHLAIGARIVEDIRHDILEKTKFHCSAGIGLNKIIAKVVCARHKPRQQTIISPQFVAKVYETTSIGSVRNLGGKLGAALMHQFGVKTMADLALIPSEKIVASFPHSASWLMKIIEGGDEEPIRAGIMPKSIAVSKNFPGKSELNTVDLVEKWVIGLAQELSRRLTEDQVKFRRTAQNIVVGFYASDRSHNSRTFPLISYAPEGIRSIAWNYMRSFNKHKEGINWSPSVTNMHISSGRFQDGVDARVREITSWFDKSKNEAVEQEAFVEVEQTCDHDDDEDDVTIIDLLEPIPKPEANDQEDCENIPTTSVGPICDTSMESSDIEILSENIVERGKTLFDCLSFTAADPKSSSTAVKKNVKGKNVKKPVSRTKKTLAKKSQKISEFFRH